MSPEKTQPGDKRLDQVIAEARRTQETQEKTYREKALKMFPWVCARCGREFSGKKRRELTVHHKDHNHDNNPADGSNWELLCIYCHDNEHSRYLDQEWNGSTMLKEEKGTPSTHKPFAALADLLKDNE